MSNTFAPILLFTYKRLETLKQTVEALKNNFLASESNLYIFSDAGKTEADTIIVSDIRSYLKTIKGFKKVEIFEAEVNLGLANSIISGVSKIVNLYGKVIVLEDDLRTTPNFLSYMNACLVQYESSEKVFSISGYSFNLGKDKNGIEDSYFLNRGWSWGWATWKNKWNDVDWKVSDYDKFSNDISSRKRFAQGGSDLNKMLDSQMTGKLDSWAIRWFYHQFKINGLTLYPVYSKVYNEGFDSNATHTTGSSSRYNPLLDNTHKTEYIFPENIEITKAFQKRFQDKMGIKARVISKIETMLLSVFK